MATTDEGRITLVGGPGDGLTLRWGDGDRVEWRPVDEREKVMVRMMGRKSTADDPIVYRRSLRTRNLFVYQP